MAFRGVRRGRRRRPRDASHQIVASNIDRLTRKPRLVSALGAPIAVAGSFRVPSNRASKARQPASPRPRTRSSNPVPSTGRVCELLAPKRRSPQIQAVRVRSGIRILSAFHVRRDKASYGQYAVMLLSKVLIKFSNITSVS